MSLTPPPLQTQENPYAAPKTIAGPMPLMEEIYIQDDCLLFPRKYDFPPVCIKSGETENLSKVRKATLAWYHPAWALLILTGVIIFVIVVLCIQKTAKVTYYLSTAELKKHRIRVATAWGLFLLGIGSLFLVSYAAEWMFLSLAAMFSAAIYGATACRVVVAKRIDERFVYLRFKGRPEALQKVYQACTKAYE